MPTLRFCHRMPFSSQKVWDSVCRTQDLLAVSTPVLHIHSDHPIPKEFATGFIFPTTLTLFGIVPWGDHTIEFISMDGRNFSYLTKESGTNIKSWTHEFRIESVDEAHCICHDTIRFEAGNKNAIVWSFGQILYRFRYYRRKKLIAKSEPISDLLLT